MGYIHGTAIKQLQGADLTRRIDIVARDDGTFQFFEQIALSKEEGGGWTPGAVSGLYESAESAELAARADFKL